MLSSSLLKSNKKHTHWGKILKKKVISFFIVFSILGFSLITPFSLGAVDETPTYAGRSYSEEAWSILYDFAGMHLEEDYGAPGPYAADLTIGASDSMTMDSKSFCAWTNIGNVQSLYIAQQNLSLPGFDQYGCSPIQILAQHFVPPGKPNTHVFVINRFLGLLAYLDNHEDGATGLPDESDEMFFGISLYSEIHKDVLNHVFDEHVPNWMLIENNTRTEATPIPLEKLSSGATTSYRFGMSYSNVFTIWNRMNETALKNQYADPVDILTGAVALSIIEEINFTYVTTVVQTNSTTSQVTTTTEYDIGNVTDLWIPFESSAISSQFGGHTENIGALSIPLAYYNSTHGVADRLDGNATFPGFSLGIVNTANIVVLDFTNVLTLLWTGFQSFAGLAGGLHNATLANAGFNITGTPIYDINFAGKPNYTLNGADTYPAHTRLLNQSKVKTSLNLLEILYFGIIINGIIGNITGANAVISGLASGILAAQLDLADFIYVTCFPEWSGGSITQDPTFTAYANVPNSNIPGFELIFVSIAGLMGLSYVVLRIRKKKRLEIS